MYIIQVKQNPNVENYIDMAEEEEPAAAKQTMKQLVGEYQSEGRIVEIKAEAKMNYNDYFEQEEDVFEKTKAKVDKLAKDIEETPNSPKDDDQENEIIWAKTSCKGEICAHYNNGECESFDDIDDPIVNNEGECQGFKPGGKAYILDEIKRVAAKLDKTPSMTDMEGHTDIDRNEYYREFDGYKDACRQAGIKPNKVGGSK